MKRKSSPKKKLSPRTILLAQRIKQLRIKQGYSSHETFANDKGLGRSQYGSYEKGRNINWETLLKIIDSLNTSVKEFFSEGFDHL